MLPCTAAGAARAAIRPRPADRRRSRRAQNSYRPPAVAASRCADHSNADDVAALFTRVIGECGRLDILVNDIWGGDDITEWQPFWTLDTAKGFEMLDRAVRTHIVTSRCAAPYMVEQNSGLIVEVTDGDHGGYRGALFYDLAKMATIRLAFAMAEELRRHRVTALAVTPGFLRSEAMLERFGVTEANWRDAAAKARGFEASESPCFVGRAVAALAADPNVARKRGGVYASWTLAREYGFTDLDGTTPHWGDYIRDSLTAILTARRDGCGREVLARSVVLAVERRGGVKPLMARVGEALRKG